MLNLNYCYRIYPDASQEKELLDWLEICRGVYNLVFPGLRNMVSFGRLTFLNSGKTL
nr:helix-turn-helix domain-containing protein [Spirulina subsalsa]